MRDRYQVPFDIRKSGKENILEWVGEDERMSKLITHCETYGIELLYLPGKDWCYIDVVGPYGKALCADGMHSMVIDVANDRFTLFGSEDIDAGIAKIDALFDVEQKRELSAELRSLYRL